MIRETFRPCCGTLTDRGRPSPHARDCPSMPAPGSSGGPYCIARSCPIAGMHRWDDARHTHDHPSWDHRYAYGPCTRDAAPYTGSCLAHTPAVRLDAIGHCPACDAAPMA